MSEIAETIVVILTAAILLVMLLGAAWDRGSQ